MANRKIEDDKSADAVDLHDLSRQSGFRCHDHLLSSGLGQGRSSGGRQWTERLMQWPVLFVGATERCHHTNERNKTPTSHGRSKISNHPEINAQLASRRAPQLVPSSDDRAHGPYPFLTASTRFQ